MCVILAITFTHCNSQLAMMIQESLSKCKYNRPLVLSESQWQGSLVFTSKALKSRQYYVSKILKKKKKKKKLTSLKIKHCGSI